MDTIDYTISSVDYEHNNRIYTNITAPHTEYCKMTITSLTTMANFVVLDTSDYIVINNKRYSVNNDYSDVNTASLVDYLNELIDTDGLEAYYDSCSRVYFTSPNTNKISIDECSYNLRLMLGLVNVELPLQTESGTLLCPDVGLFLSTPVLYLACNLGSNSYRTAGKSFTSMRILMRLTNSFFAKQPIVNVNGDFTTTVKCSDLSDVRFTLIDANYHEVKLLTPMYLTVQIESIPDSESDPASKVPIQTQEIQMSPIANMIDLTERGREYTDKELENCFIMPASEQGPRPNPEVEQK